MHFYSILSRDFEKKWRISYWIIILFQLILRLGLHKGWRLFIQGHLHSILPTFECIIYDKNDCFYILKTFGGSRGYKRAKAGWRLWKLNGHYERIISKRENNLHYFWTQMHLRIDIYAPGLPRIIFACLIGRLNSWNSQFFIQ